MGLKQRIATQFFGLFVLIADFLYVAYLSYYGKLDFQNVTNEIAAMFMLGSFLAWVPMWNSEGS